VFAIHLNARSPNDAPVYNVELSPATASAEIRAKFGETIERSRRNRTPLPPFLNGVYISNIVNLNTVVKIEILKALKTRNFFMICTPFNELLRKLYEHFLLFISTFTFDSFLST
jgi:hypothetical protein